MPGIRLTRRGTIGICSCKVGGCRKCGSTCRRCKCACDGISPLEALSRKVGKRQRSTTDKKPVRKRSTRASSRLGRKDDKVDERDVRRSKGDNRSNTTKDSLDDSKREKSTSSRKPGMRSTRNSTKGRASTVGMDHNTSDEDERNVHRSSSNEKISSNELLEQNSKRDDVLICTIVNEETSTNTSRSKKRKAAEVLQSHNNEDERNVHRSKKNTNTNKETSTTRDSLDKNSISDPVNDNTTNSLK